MMDLIFAKLFEEYIRKNDPAKFKIVAYISIFYFFLAFVIFLPIITFLEHKVFINEIQNRKTIIKIGVFSLLSIIFYLVHYTYIKNKRIYKLVAKYKSRKINKTFFYLIVILSPVMLLILAGTITVYLNGGEILGTEIKSLLE
ncbi:hypothetical protein [Flavobacterium sp. CAN_S2]|uniref:hypothetical protein n=1 Tax=Flavobacterium sp. CAN_S2 TaxID=2787726 RepID=UPI0018CB2A00